MMCCTCDYSRKRSECEALRRCYRQLCCPKKKKKGEGSSVRVTLYADKTDGFGNPLPGALFRLHGLENSTDRFVTSDGNGVAVFSRLRPGLYDLIEAEAPYGFVPSTERIRFRITKSGKLYVNGSQQSSHRFHFVNYVLPTTNGFSAYGPYTG